MRISWAVGELVMQAMDGNPIDGSSLESQRATNGHDVFEPLWRDVAAMSEEAVIAHANPHVLTQHPEHRSDGECRPAKEKQGGDSADVEGGDPEGEVPVEAGGTALGERPRVCLKRFRGKIFGR